MNMAEKIYNYDPAEALDSQEAIVVFMADAFETGDAAYIAKALGIVARAKGMADIAYKTGLSREQLYRSFSVKGNPTLKTMLTVMRALGMDMTAKIHTKGLSQNNLNI
jgi:probable addiction module antidote protein